MGRPTLLRVRLVHYETSHQKDAFVSTFFCLFLSLPIVTMFCNLVLLNVCKYLLSSLLLQFASVCYPRSFWIPSPSPGSMATACIWYDLGATQEVLHQMRIGLSRGLPAITSPLRAESPSPSRRPAAVPIRPIHEEEFVKALRGGSSAPSTASTGPFPPVVTTSPKTEKKKRRKHKSVKRTVTSETVSLPEKKEESNFRVPRLSG